MVNLKHQSEITAVNVINGLLGLLLIVSPWLFGFSAERTPAWTAVLSGVLIGVVALTTFFDLREWQGWVTLALGIWSIVAPWLLGFSGQAHAMWSFVGVGVVVAILAALEVWAIHDNPHNVAT